MKKIGSFVLFFIFFSPVYAQLSFKAEVDRNQMGVDDELELVLTLKSSKKISSFYPNMSLMKDFEITRQSSSQSTSISIINSQMTKTITKKWIYFLSPSRQGVAQIPSFSLKVKNQTYKTKPLVIKVVPGSLGSVKKKSSRSSSFLSPFSPFDEPDEMFNRFFKSRRLSLNDVKKNVFIKAKVSDDSLYLGQSVFVDFYLYVHPQMRLTNYQITPPELKGFWKESLKSYGTKIIFEDVPYKGETFKRALLTSLVLSPIKTGVLSINSLSLGFNLLSVGLFGSSYTVKSDSKKIVVKPLPSPKPDNFTGGVGDFAMSFSLDSTKVKVNEVVSLKLNFQGRGNARLIDVPDLQIKNIQILKGEKKSGFLENKKSFKNIELLLIPLEPGLIETPEIKLSFFNPYKKSFYYKKIPSLQFNVSGTSSVSAKEDVVEKKTPFNVDQYFNSSYFSLSFAPLDQFVLGLFVLILVILVLLYKYYILFFRKKSHTISIQISHRLNKIDHHIYRGDVRSFAKESLNLFQFTLNFCFDSEHQSLRQIMELLSPRWKDSVKDPIFKTIERLEVLAFAPNDPMLRLDKKKEMRQLYKDIKSQISLLIKKGGLFDR